MYDASYSFIRTSKFPLLGLMGAWDVLIFSLMVQIPGWIREFDPRPSHTIRMTLNPKPLNPRPRLQVLGYQGLGLVQVVLL